MDAHYLADSLRGMCLAGAGSDRLQQRAKTGIRPRPEGRSVSTMDAHGGMLIVFGLDMWNHPSW
jgi:hypothetical protein